MALKWLSPSVIWEHGSPSPGRLPILIAPKGYLASEAATFEALASSAVEALLEYAPWGGVESKLTIGIVRGFGGDPESTADLDAILAKVKMREPALFLFLAEGRLGGDQGAVSHGRRVAVLGAKGGQTYVARIFAHECGHLVAGLVDEYHRRRGTAQNVAPSQAGYLGDQERDWTRLGCDPPYADQDRSRTAELAAPEECVMLRQAPGDYCPVCHYWIVRRVTEQAAGVR